MRKGRTLGNLGQVSSINIVIRLEENLSQARLSDGIVLQIELIEPMERVLVGVHVESIDREVVGGELQRFEDLLQSEFVPITVDYKVLFTIVTFGRLVARAA